MRPLLLLARTWKTIGFGVLVAGAGAISTLRRQNSRPVVEFALKLSKAPLARAIGKPLTTFEDRCRPGSLLSRGEVRRPARAALRGEQGTPTRPTKRTAARQ